MPLAGARIRPEYHNVTYSIKSKYSYKENRKKYIYLTFICAEQLISNKTIQIQQCKRLSGRRTE